MTITVFIIIPALTLDGPIKGAVALANEISKFFQVKIISLKGGDEHGLNINDSVDLIDLHIFKNWIKKYNFLLKIFNSDRKKNIIISYCFSADLFSVFFKKHAVLCCSIRANNFKNYRFSYGVIGILIALFHYKLLKLFDRVYVLDKSMEDLIKKFSNIKDKTLVVSNFIDEKYINKFRKSFNNSNKISIIFVGSLTDRKQPQLLINSVIELLSIGLSVNCIFLGDGPLKNDLISQVKLHKLEEHIEIKGFLNNPIELLASSDIFVLPSLSEGTPRAALEALFLGLPVVLRNVDGNQFLIKPKFNGDLFNSDNELTLAIRNAIKIFYHIRSSNNDLKPNLLPIDNYQCHAIQKLIDDIRYLSR